GLELSTVARRQILAKDAGIVVAEDEPASLLVAHAEKAAQMEAELLEARRRRQENSPALSPPRREELARKLRRPTETNEVRRCSEQHLRMLAGIEAHALHAAVADQVVHARIASPVENRPHRPALRLVGSGP